MLNPQAYTDVLGIAVRFQRWFGGITRSEIHLYSYLACLLAIYRGIPAAEWGYGFVATDYGVPFSSEVDSAIDVLLGMGALVDGGGQLVATKVAVQEHEVLQQLSDGHQRDPFLEGAASAALSLPRGLVRHSLCQESQLRTALDLRATRRLLQEAGLEILYEQFQALGRAVGFDPPDLMVPATVWLRYLGQAAPQ